MLKNNLYSHVAVGALLGFCLSAPAHAQLVDEIVVTATKRAESAQDIPVAVTALGEDTLDELNVNIFTDYLKQLPGVTAGGSGPGQSTIYIRGVASTTPTLQVAGVAGLAPNVALYLDEQPLSQPGRNLDVYAADLERVEVLAGPQGTLFGASSQAGTVRLITNSPKIGVEEAGFKAGVSFTKGGDASYNAEAVYNAPIGEKTALRAVVYYDQQGGYIDNLAGTINARESGRFRPAGTIRLNGLPVAPERAGFQSTADLSGVTFLDAENSRFVEDNFNDASYFGFRVGALHEFNDDWSLELKYAHQEIDSDGVFYFDPTLGDDLDIQRYSDDRLDDDFDNLSWTLKGRLGALEAVYTGAYTDREADQNIDYTDYLFVGQYIPYYICDGSVTYPAAAPSGTCQAPDLNVDSFSKTKVNTHEIRFNTPAEHSLRATVGGFYSDLRLRERANFNYPGSINAISFNGTPGFSPNNLPAQGATVLDASAFAPGTIFRNDVLRTDEQFGIFGEATYDFSEKFALTIGARYYDVEVDLVGSAAGSFGNFGGTGDNNAGNNLDTLFDGDPNPDTASTDGVIFKFTGTYTPTDDILLYATYSQGFRPGLLNRPGGSTNAAGTFTVPFALDTDEVDNYEFGWKTTLANNQVRFNGSAFYVDIQNLQTTIFDPNITNLTFSANATNAKVMGVEGNITYAPESIEGLTLTGAFSLLDTEATDVLVPTNDVIVGDSLAFAPEVQLNLRARYEWDMKSGLLGYVSPSVIYSANSFSDIITINRALIDSSTLLGLSAGVESDNWGFEVYATNLTDSLGEQGNIFVQDRFRVTPTRPRTIGARVSYNFR